MKKDRIDRVVIRINKGGTLITDQTIEMKKSDLPLEAPIEPLPSENRTLFATLNSLHEAQQMAYSVLKKETRNDIYSVLMIYQNTLMRLLKNEQYWQPTKKQPEHPIYSISYWKNAIDKQGYLYGYVEWVNLCLKNKRVIK